MIEFKNILQSRTFRGVIVGLAIAVVAIIVFQAGVFVGYRKAAFSFRFGDNYYRTFGDDRRGMMLGLPADNLPGGHGAVGKIVKVALPNIVIADKDNTEKSLVISDDTIIRQLRQTATAADLRTGEMVVVVGAPNDDGQIEAKFIRIIPSPKP